MIQVEEKITSFFKDSTKRDQIDPQEDLFDLGVTSLNVVQVTRKIEEAFQINVPIETLLENPTISHISEYVCSHKADRRTAVNSESEQKDGMGDNYVVETASAATDKKSTAVDLDFRNREVQEKITSFFQESIKRDRIDPQEDLFDLGVTSLNIVQVTRKIEQAFQINVPIEALLENPTISNISEYVCSHKTDYRTEVNSESEQKDGMGDNYVVETAPGVTNETSTVMDLDFGIQELAEKEKAWTRINEQYNHTEEVLQQLGNFKKSQYSNAVIELQKVQFRKSVYAKNTITRHFSEEVVAFEKLSHLISLLGPIRLGEKSKYLYPSSGGLNAVQTYVYIKENRVKGVEYGIYYYHPEKNTLCLMTSRPVIDRSIFFEGDYQPFNDAAFCLFFIAQLEEIEPIYQTASPSLVTLDAGYMGQLLLSRQEDFGLGLSPVGGIDFDRIRNCFKLNKTHKFIHCMLGGVLPSGDSFEFERTRGHRGMLGYLQNSSKELTEHYQEYSYSKSFSSFLDVSSRAGHEEIIFPTEEVINRVHEKRNSHIDGLNRQRTVIELEKWNSKDEDYQLRSCKRTYLEKPVSFHQFSKFISLLRCENIQGKPCFLYPSMTETYSIRSYVWVKEDGVKGIAEGLYYYHPVKHCLVLVQARLSQALLKTCYTPFNRKHYHEAKFCLFLIGRLSAMKPFFKDESLYFALLEAGYMGQLLMDKQAEFDMGICPIGALRFEKIRPDFLLEEDDELLHSFTCGGFELEIPEDRKFLEIGRGRESIVEDLPNRVLVGNGTNGLKTDIAIVGMSGRYPGAENLEDYWVILKEGKTCFGEMPIDRLALSGNSYRQNQDSQEMSNWGSYLYDIDCFDALLFNISPAEAKNMDPQERLFMEVVWECLENAGYTSSELNQQSTKVGVFVGAMWSDYQSQGSDRWEKTKIATALSIHSAIANRISYFFNFTGPSISLDTSCSSAMTAIHFACENIKKGDCGAAIVGGVNIMCHPYHQGLLHAFDLLSNDSECHPFGAQANGWVAGEGVGAILIKPRDKAERDGDYIHGIIKGTAIGHSGKAVRYGAPNASQQKDSILQALSNAGVSTRSISYIEAAAPGASLADASEMTAITKVFQNSVDGVSDLNIGSVKSNIGHLESASAMSQLAKVLLQMKHQQITPSLNSKPLNPLIQIEDNGIKIVDRLKFWNGRSQKDPSEIESKDYPRRALINAFGAFGSGGHVVVEEYANGQFEEKRKQVLIVLSAATEEQLLLQACKLHKFLETSNSQRSRLADIGYTLRVGRNEMKKRLAVIVDTTLELQEKLQLYLDGAKEISGFYRGGIVKDKLIVADPTETNLAYVAQKWVLGAKFNWDAFKDGDERRIPLPTYPFAKERHWVEGYLENGNTEQSLSIVADKSLAPASCLATKRSILPDQEFLLEKAEDYLKRLFSKVSEISIPQINVKTSLEEYGISSIMIRTLNTSLENDFGELSKTLFFEYQTINQLASYFINNHQDQLKILLDYSAPPENAIVNDRFEKVGYPPEERRISSPYSSNGGKETACDIAIIGLNGRYPKSKTIGEFWENLKNGVDCITEIPQERWDHQQFFNPDKHIAGKSYSKWGGFIDDVARFDPLFFNISPKEAETLDPQERLFLETVWHTFEDAGYSRVSLERAFDRKVGIFVGVMYGEYQLLSDLNRNNGDCLSITSMYGSIANRISYFFNLIGPSMAVDTMCSSSLTALHLAIESIKRGECESAIAGGVNLSIHPNKYIQLSQLTMSSTDGRCRSFGEGGDGFVPGEGVGAIFVKPLSRAVNDGDHIYAVIKGMSINHGGKTNGYTVPNPNAQAKLISDALAKAKVNPGTISYIEAHGTGTSLGDPIEITGLSKVIKGHRADKQFCSIGSVKSNIGHLEAAAGIAGLTKVLLQLKHQQLVPSLHSKKLNENINFEKSPFHVQQKLTEWRRPTVEVDGETKEYPRIAGISSFGAGGANAHVILEEYEEHPPVKNKSYKPHPTYIIILSAKSEERLEVVVKNLYDFLKDQIVNPKSETLNLINLAYTLQVGREAMEERLGFVVGSMQELTEKLNGFIESEDNIENLYRDQVKRNKKSLAVFTGDEDMVNVIDAWISKRKYTKILDLWVKGIEIDWHKLYDKEKPVKISLPTYPFARERYWPPPSPSTTAEQDSSPGTSKTLHPLVHENTSTLEAQRFTSTFTGQESFWEERVGNEHRTFPGTGYLEMVRAAVDHSMDAMDKDRTKIRLRDVIWGQALTMNGDPKKVHIGLFVNQDNQITYEICSSADNANEGFVLHNQGVVTCHDLGEQPKLDLLDLRQEIDRNRITFQPCPSAFKAGQVDHRARHQGIDEIYMGNDQVLVKLSAPSSISGTPEQFILNPSLMESVFQASVGLILGFNETLSSSSTNDTSCGIKTRKSFLLYALQEIEILGSCTSSMWAWIRYSKDRRAQDQIQKLNIDLCHDTGTVVVQMKGLEIGTSTNITPEKNINPPDSTPRSQSQEPFEVMTFEETWQEQNLAKTPPVKIKNLVCFLSDPENQQAVMTEVQKLDPQTKVIFITQGTSYRKLSQQSYSICSQDDSNFEELFNRIWKDHGAVEALFYLWTLEDPGCIQDHTRIMYILQGISLLKATSPKLLLVSPFKNTLDRCYLESWIGFERSIGLVLPNMSVGVIFQETDNQTEKVTIIDWIQILYTEFQTSKVQSVLYQKGKRHVCRIKPTIITQSGTELLKSGQTYLITGGCGGLGLLFAEHFAKKQPMNLILTGRSILTQDKQNRIKLLEDLGSKVFYLQADVCNLAQMNKGLKGAKKRFGKIHGVIHAAGIESGQTILEKEIKDFQRVLNPKIKGTLVLDEVMSKEPLDFICYFSSSSAILGDFGSCDYAIGNRFQVAYAQYRNDLQAQGKRQGKATVINWPLWKDGGMGFSKEEDAKLYLKSSGQRFLKAKEGLKIFDQILSQNATQYLVLVGQTDRIYRFLGLSLTQSSNVDTDFLPSLNNGRRPELKGLSVEQCTTLDLRKAVSDLLKIERDKLDIEINLADFGFDSIRLVEFARLLTKHYGIEITPSLFFSHSTLEQLTRYFVTEHAELIQNFYLEKIVQESPPPIPLENTITLEPVRSKKSRYSRHRTSQGDLEPIAIIGMSGRFPRANSVDELWEILSSGKCAITKMPWDRSNNNGHYDGSKNGKIPGNWGGFLPDMSCFDPLFFEISPKEAQLMDPCQRLFLEEAWHVLEDAGYMGERIRGSSCGVYVGVEEGEYRLVVAEKAQVNSNQNASLSARIAYSLDLKGPNMALTAACSSGLVAIHQACQALRQGDCEMAVAGGINLLISPMSYLGLSQAGMLSPNGKCRVFDQQANGIVPGEAVAVVVLKPLSKAIKDNDQIYGCIKASGVNYDGNTNGITAPNPLSQAELITNIYNKFNINPQNIQYVMSHSVGSKLGDPIEMEALTKAFCQFTDKKQFCSIGSIKPLIGHTFAASGVVSLISMLLAIKHQMIPATINFESKNEFINFGDSPFILRTNNQPWRTKDSQPRLGVIGTTGISGTNAHAVIEEFRENSESRIHKAETDRGPYLIILSANNEDRLKEYAKKLNDYLKNNRKFNNPTIRRFNNLANIAYTLQSGRDAMKARVAILASSIPELSQKLNIFISLSSEEFRDNSIFVRDGETSKKDSMNRPFHRKEDDLRIQTSMKEQKLDQLALLWVNGAIIPWEELWEGCDVGRISLPTYPFYRRRCWINSRPNNNPKRCRDIPDFDEDYYRHLSAKISEGELSEDEVEKMFMVSR